MRNLVLLTRTVCVALMLALASGCASNARTRHDNANPQAAAKTLLRLDHEWSASAATRDAEKVAAFYAEDAVVYPPNEPVGRGRAAAKKVWAAYLADPSFQISWKSNDAKVADDGRLVGYTAGNYEASYNGPDGKKMTEKGKFLCVWQKQPDGSWKAIRDIWNADSK